MKKVLWLTSWYPNKLDNYNGDFIQRHARAVALYCEVQVIHVQIDFDNILQKTVEVYKNKNGRLSETIILIASSKIFSPFKKITNQLKYIRTFKQAIKNYIKNNGDPNIVHVHVALKAGVLALWMKRKWKIPYVLTEHWGMYNDKATDNFRNKHFIFKYLTRKIIQQSAAFLPVSRSLGVSVNNVAAKKKFDVTYNVVDTSLFYHYNKKRSTTFQFIHASVMNHGKNPIELMNAFYLAYQHNKNIRLLMVGPAPEDVKIFPQKIGLSNDIIQFTESWASYSEVASYMQQSHAFILFSISENMPCVILEALCCGLPVISSNVGGISEVIDETNGILVESRNTQQLSKAIIDMYENCTNYHPEDISQRAQKMFSYQTIGKQILDIYDNIYTK